MSKVKFHVTFDVEFDTTDLEEDELTKLKQLTAKQIKEKIDAGFENDSYDFFGESLSMLGMLTPSVKTVLKVN